MKIYIKCGRKVMARHWSGLCLCCHKKNLKEEAVILRRTAHLVRRKS